MIRTPEWITALEATKEARQIIVVAGVGKTTAFVSMHEKMSDGTWRQVMSTPGFIGRRGLGKEREGDEKTPVGVFRFTAAFGNLEDPGCALPYTHVDPGHYWSGDHRPGMRYNKMVHISELPELDRENSEHLVDFGACYNYCLDMGYNRDCVVGLGSALFFHCLSPVQPYTAGCVAVPETAMHTVMTHVQPDCVLVIDSLERLGGRI